MTRKAKPLPFKKGMKVVWLSRHYDKVSLTEAEVTVVTSKDGEPVIHCRHIDSWGNEWKRKFSTVAGMFQEDPYPVWQLQPLNGQSMKALHRKAEKASKRHQAYRDAYNVMQREVESESRAWEREEVCRRGNLIPNGPKFLANVISRMGFKKPKNGVRVKIKDREEVIVARHQC